MWLLPLKSYIWKFCSLNSFLSCQFCHLLRLFSDLTEASSPLDLPCLQVCDILPGITLCMPCGHCSWSLSTSRSVLSSLHLRSSLPVPCSLQLWINNTVHLLCSALGPEEMIESLILLLIHDFYPCLCLLLSLVFLLVYSWFIFSVSRMIVLSKYLPIFDKLRFISLHYRKPQAPGKWF